MRKLWLGIIGLAAASTANAAVVTYTLSYNDDGTGTATPGVFAVYAQASPGDNGGIFATGVDLTGNIDFIGNTLPGYSFKKTTIPTNTKFAGFLAGFAADIAAGKVSGLQDLSKGADLLPVYGFGQDSGDLLTLKPSTHNAVTDVNGNGSTYAAKLLVAVGTVPAGTDIKTVKFDRASVDNKASVWDDRSGIENVIAQLVMVDVPPPAHSFTLDATGTKGTNQAVGGSIAVTGSNNKYSSEVDQLLNPSTDVGNAPIATINGEPGAIYVMAKLTGSAADIATLLGELTTDVDNTDSQFAALHGNYDGAFGAGGFNALFRFPNDAAAANRTINWDLSGSGVTVDQLAAVPEPATISLLGLGALGLLARRRRTA